MLTHRILPLAKCPTLRRFLSSDKRGMVLERIGNKFLVTLDRPRTRNAIDLLDVQAIREPVMRWYNDTKLAVICAKGPIFSAGGDLKLILEMQGDRRQMLASSYEMFFMMSKLPYPVVTLIQGPAIGAGAALAMHCTFRVATENASVSFPETAIGLYPDNGATYILNQVEGKLGAYIGLTACTLDAQDAYHAGFATHMCDGCRLSELKTRLLDLEDCSRESVKAVLDEYTSSFKSHREFSLQTHLDDLERYFSAETAEEILQCLDKDGSDWAQLTAKRLRRRSPTSLKVTKRAIEEARGLPLADCLYRETLLTQRLMAEYDFLEGVRAVLLDKDGKPKWQPSTLQEVTKETLDRLFGPPTEDDYVANFN